MSLLVDLRHHCTYRRLPDGAWLELKYFRDALLDL